MIVQSVDLTAGQVDDQVRAALAGRIVIEQAKGVLADALDLDMAAAYLHLVDHAAATGTTLTDTAAHLIAQAQRRT